MRALSFRFFWTPYLVFLIGMVFLLARTAHGDVVLWVNARRTPLLDVAFPLVTFLGDWLVMVVIFIYCLTRSKKIALVFMASLAGMGLVSTFLKRVVFPGVPRPKGYFQEGVLNFIEGVEVHSKFSFPSGHTLSVFFMATFLSIVVTDKRWSMLFVFAAILTGVSRIYLLQHFLIDVVAGSVVGIMLGVATLLVFRSGLSI